MFIKKNSNLNILFTILIVLVSLVFIVNCENSENLNIKINNDDFNLVFIDGTLISTDKYNEINPVLFESDSKIYLAYATDNPNLPDHKGGYDIYYCLYNVEKKGFEKPC